MSERIVVETTKARREALASALEIQGETLKEWFEDQLSLAIEDPVQDQGISVDELDDPERLNDVSAIMAELTEQDWAFTNDDTSYLTHDVHPYPAKFIPQIPAVLIGLLSCRGDQVFDPFGGGGTTATEAVRLRRRAVSLDANPLAALMGRVKTAHLTQAMNEELDALGVAVQSHIIEAKNDEGGWRSDLAKRQLRTAPLIPNFEKWFDDAPAFELSLLLTLIDSTTSGAARDVARLALSRIVIRVSNQDSETRYVAKAKNIQTGFALRAFLEALKSIQRKVNSFKRYAQSADAKFLIGDSRNIDVSEISPKSVGLIVSSPPYPNATDYHLYHRFRLFWLGFDPRELGKVEIGSHLKHQREKSGFDEYCNDMKLTLEGCFEVLQPSRYAVFVVGDAIFNGEKFDTSAALAKIAKSIGYEVCGVVERPIHNHRRSFSKPARRARSEKILILKRPNERMTVILAPPPYKMWEYEKTLRRLEIESLIGKSLPLDPPDEKIKIDLDAIDVDRATKLTFTSSITSLCGLKKPTWQSILENGASKPGKRKEPKYATHGIHPFKGKFYPQLAKCLINIAGISHGSVIYDPFCGSGTVLLEAYLNGYKGFGSDMNPLAAAIAKAKTEILEADKGICEQSIRSLLKILKKDEVAVDPDLSEFPVELHEELQRWFPEPVLFKLNWLLKQIRLFGDHVLREFLEVIASSIIRDVSQQDPKDLRIRRRAEEISDAPVIELFTSRLEDQFRRLEQHWQIASMMPCKGFPANVVEGDCRDEKVLEQLGLKPSTIDLVVTSPPYATALPYIDTDRLSLLTIKGMARRDRSSIETALTGSREISKLEKDRLEEELSAQEASKKLPQPVLETIRKIQSANQKANVGFRRKNMPALLWRYFLDMKSALETVHCGLKPGAKAFFVVGDSRTKAGEDWVNIETGAFLGQIATDLGFKAHEVLKISVTKEAYKHVKNTITENQILCFSKSKH